MSTRMLIDARHPEETRVAVADGNRIQEFDFESSEHKQLKGNIYLAKVTRVEPSLQAAFIEYGGNRHGFLAFSEIHPDYYQIPKEDRDQLLAEEAEHAAEEARLRDEEGDLEPVDGHHEDDGTDDRPAEPDEEGLASDASPVDDTAVEQVRNKRRALRRRYKIQDVIQRRQVLLVQVVKEERGNKGAALTTYLSLAGRYCVLMPNTSHGGGISRKISNGADRKRLKQIMSDLKLPGSMGLIVRTAGLSRTKTEIKRDFDYLARLWDEIREKTLKSAAPSLIYRDSDLVKRAIRDLYSREIDEVLVEGEDGYKAARRFMKLLMPSHVKRVQQYDDPTPIFQRYGIEDQLGGMYNPTVQLKSGGYLVINPTEALVSIDINSGRSTKEHNIEQTAFQTNLEAAKEIARQLRLRDMAGLIVIDFIDMEQNGHVRKVERAMKDALKTDRARIQVGRISSFGLLEMSRQRLRTGVLEASTHACPHCDGTGLMRTASSSGLSALRMIEDEAARGKGTTITLCAGREAAIFLLNKKRAELAEVEERYGVTVEVEIDEKFEGAKMRVESKGPRPTDRPKNKPIVDVKPEPIEDDEDVEEVEEAEDARDEEEDREDRPKRRRRRRGGRGRRRGGRDRDEDRSEGGNEDEGEPSDAVKADAEAPEEAAEEEAKPKKRRSRSRKKKDEGDTEGDAATEDKAEEAKAEPAEASDEEEAPAPKTRRRPRAKKADADAKGDEPKAEKAKADETEEKPAPKKRRTRAKKADADKAKDEAGEEAGEKAADKAPETPAEEGEKPKKRRTRAKKVEDKPDSGEGPAEPAAGSATTAAGRRPRAKKADKAEAPAEAKTETKAAAEPAPAPATEGADDGDKPAPRKGWWQRTFG
ncbi:Rne/Rng family ribonuclease [Sphingomicrobium aestuariivivum]|uniref:Rne/Rng family ribonuclease n=1 Tax=Sphingomicrobium aestuariivivum TaxID=1582356 RepID=UPI001FD6405D|nr:Rne/Rng family ribonuclease [Sphingomicrobium aestuariivivum]MCJ8190516.1 Rne/Rng family ribonuclease [Sphingomicrobium aestuariivivum]